MQAGAKHELDTSDKEIINPHTIGKSEDWHTVPLRSNVHQVKSLNYMIYRRTIKNINNNSFCSTFGMPTPSNLNIVDLCSFMN